MRVAFIHNFSIEYDWNLWQTYGQTECPTHHLWGATHLAKHGIDVYLLPYEKYNFLKRLGYSLGLGDLDHQIRLLLTQSEYDVVYSACQTGTVLLSILRCLGLFRRPLVVKLERPFKVNWLSRILIKIFAGGHDRLLCLSARVRDQLRDEFEIDAAKLPILNWGADVAYYDQHKPTLTPAQRQVTPFILSAGNTSRDYKTLIEACNDTPYPVRIYCSAASAPKMNNLSNNIRVYYDKGSTEARALSFPELLAEYEQSGVVAIPLEVPASRINSTTLIGLTSLLEAMVMGKAVIMTKHRQVNIDVEKAGIGLWVEPGDVEGWRRAIAYCIENPQKVQEMGKKARELCKVYNLEVYSAQLTAELKQVQAGYIFKSADG
jgi:glycosyltransferase involved in cell wall biosynthesis